MTWDDPNSFKRWLQRRRIADALSRIPVGQPIGLIVDYGGGDGFLALHAASRWPEAAIVIFEPYTELAQAARARLSDIPQAFVVEHEADLPTGAEIVFCTEVFEHLPEAETDRALWEINRLLKPGGLLVIGVPVEIGPIALLKGLFRHARRPRAYDGDLPRIVCAALGSAPSDRPNERLGPDRRYHSFHLGFDHRSLKTRLEAFFGAAQLTGSPVAFAPGWLNAEVYMRFTKPERSPIVADIRQQEP